MRKFLLTLLGILTIFMFKSCTYSLSIDTKLFVSSISVDVDDSGNFSINFSYPDISEFSPESSKIKGGGSVSGFGKTFYEAVGDIISKTQRTVDLEHVKVIILSSKIAKDEKNLKKFLDFLSHEPQISRRVYVCVGDGNGSDYVTFKPKSGEDSQVFISDLIEHNNKENGVKSITLNDLFDYFSQNKVVLVPLLKLNEDKTSMKISGSYILDDYKFVEELNLKDSMIINFLRGESFKILNEIPYKDGNIDFEAQNINRKIKILDSGSVILNFDLKTIIKNCLDINHDNLNNDFLNEIKNYLDQNIYNSSINLVNRFYKDEMDILNFENYIYKFKNSIWKTKIKDKGEWMKQLEVKINIQNNITNIGNISF